MTFERVSALAKMVSKYQGKMTNDNVVILISFDQLSELRAKCTKAMMLTQDQEYLLGCKLIVVHEHDYLAVAYESQGYIYNKQEVKP